MSGLNEHGLQVVADLAQRHGFSGEAVTHMLVAVSNGFGTQAQFNHWEFGGMGQWSMGGMIMIGDMFNNGLKARVDGLCNDLGNALNAQTLFNPQPQHHHVSVQSQSAGGSVSFSSSGMSTGSGWPPELGQSSSQGSQNDMRYALFPQTRRLAISVGGRTTIYDTLDHQIGGFGQAQGGDQTLSFTSQHGLVRVSDLPVVPMPAMPAKGDAPAKAEPATPPPATPATAPAKAATATVSEDEIFSLIEKLADLHGKGILTDDEFQSKKTELLSRL